MAEYDYDLFVIGGGSGGVRAARIAAGHGARVAVAEEFRFGGTCVIRGCVPKKLYVLASRFADDFREAGGFGWTVGDASFSWPALVAAKNKEIDRLEGAYADTLGRAGVETIRARAEFVDAHRLRLSDGREVSARSILVATGGHPVRPDIPGAELALTSNEVFDMPLLPARMIIAGGGYIAVEFACMLQRLGVAVTLVYRGDAILRGFDSDISAVLTDAMRSAGVEILLRSNFTGISRASDGFVVDFADGERRETGAVLLATGRQPNTAGLGLEHAGVAVDGVGAVVVDEHSQSSIATIYAVGDVTNRLNLTPVAIREGHAFADSLFGGKPWTADHDFVPTAVFSTPEIGTVGFGEQAARKAGHDVVIYKTSFRAMKATLSGSDARVFMKLVVDRASERILGVHIVGEGAAEMAQLLAISVRMGATKSDFDATMPLHPTAAEELVTLRTPSS